MQASYTIGLDTTIQINWLHKLQLDTQYLSSDGAIYVINQMALLGKNNIRYLIYEANKEIKLKFLICHGLFWHRNNLKQLFFKLGGIFKFCNRGVTA